MRNSVITASLVLACTTSAWCADLAPLIPAVATGERASKELRRRVDLNLRALTANAKELDKLRPQDPSGGIWIMEHNAFWRARLQLLQRLSLKERNALFDGQSYVSPPYGKLPKVAQAQMDSAIGTDQIDPALRVDYRYMLHICISEGAEQLMINQLHPDGRPRSGGSVVTGPRRGLEPSGSLK
jgi:hypothetical protein